MDQHTKVEKMETKYQQTFKQIQIICIKLKTQIIGSEK